MICSSGIGFDPRVDGQTLEFGFHGIWQGTAVLYDRQTDSRWLHLTGECIEGPMKGKKLRPIPGRHVQWWEWKRDHPAGEVMAPDPHHQKMYFPRFAALRGADIFPPAFPSTIQNRDDRLHPSALLFGIRTANACRAYPFNALFARPGSPILNDRVGETPVVLLYDPQSRSVVAHGRTLDGRVVDFEISGDGLLRDPVSDSTFDRDGWGVSGSLKGQRLPQLFGMQAEWYGWFAAFPQTEIWDPGAR